jgi:hypothetical protein
MINLNHKPTLTEKFLEKIDAFLVSDRSTQKKRRYLGMSDIGKCERMLCYKYADSNQETFGGKTLRIFQRGHWGEKYTKWLFRKSGFTITGDQHEMSVLNGKFKGHIDGVITGGPLDIGYPALWEHKTICQKNFNKFKKHKLKTSASDYYDQVQIYMAYTQLHDNPAIFSAQCVNEMDFYFEEIPFDQARAQELSDKAIKIIDAVENGELLERPYNDSCFFICKWCYYQKECWA